MSPFNLLPPGRAAGANHPRSPRTLGWVRDALQQRQTAGTLLVGMTVAAFLTGCPSTDARHYYTLTYPVDNARFAEPHPTVLRVREVNVRDTYRGAEIVFRPDVHEIQFYRRRRWSERPQKMLTDLMRDHVRASGVVKSVISDLGQTPPAFTLESEVEALEELAADNERFARLSMSFKLVSYSDDRVVWRYRFDGRRPVSGVEVRGTVREMSELFRTELDKALDELRRFLDNPQGYVPPQEEKAAAPPDDDEHSSAIFGPDPDSPLLQLPQLLRDDTHMPLGYGAVFLPALSNRHIQEPRVYVLRGGDPFMDGLMGKRLVMRPGVYELRFGSGTTQQQLRAKVRVEDGKTTVLDPSRWAVLDVSVVDQRFVPFRGSYELIDMAKRQDFGLGFGADALVGEQTRVWVLPEGLYKVIQAGGTYRDRVNFATVRLMPGEFTEYTLVIDQETGDFLGAGETMPLVVGDGQTEVSNWTLRAVIGGNLDFKRSNQVAEQEGWNLGVNLFLDTMVTYDDRVNLWINRLEIEESQIRPAGADNFRNLNDRIFANSIYIYQWTPTFGPYARVLFESKLLPRYDEFDTPRDIQRRDMDGEVVELIEQAERIEIGGPFSPMLLRQDAGGNLRLLRSRFLDFDIRAGIGSEQVLTNGLMVRTPVSGGPDLLDPLEDNVVFGLAGTAVALARFSRYVTASSELDSLLPVTEGDELRFTWRNQVNLRLASFASLVYRFNAQKNPGLDVADRLRTQHDVQLRFSYTIF